MNKVLLGLAMLTIGAAFLPAAPPLVPQSPTARAWANLQQGVTNKHSGKRTNAIHALRLLREDPRAQEMAESALADPNAKVRAAAARALGLMAALSAVPRLEAALNDKESAVVLAAAHSLFLLGQPEKPY
jgi:HEAT repeat protein